jgi:SAM-dependent methyltransferase
MDTDTIRSDFDRLAPYEDESWGHNSHYHSYLLKYVPAPCENTLDIGCGTGQFARLLAGRAKHVTALDLSPEMVKIAQSRSQDYSNLAYQVSDVLAQPLPDAHFDCIASIATLHHIPLEAILPKIADALKPGGVFMALDLFKVETLADFLLAAAAIPVGPLLKLLKTGHLRQSAASRAAWETHGRHDRYLTLSEVRQSCARFMPGAKVTRHLLWRYSIIWQKPVV